MARHPRCFRRTGSFAHHVSKDGAAIVKLATTQVFAVEVHDVERYEHGAMRVLAGERGIGG